MGWDAVLCVADILQNVTEEGEEEAKEPGGMITDIYSVKKKEGTLRL